MTENPTPLAKAIDEDKNFLFQAYQHNPPLVEKIETYFFGISILINETLKRKSEMDLEAKLDELCRELDQDLEMNLYDLPKEILDFLAHSRKVIRKRILAGDIRLDPVHMEKTSGLVR